MGEPRANTTSWEACPEFGGLRIPVATILGQLAAGRTEAEIREDFPDLEHEEIPAALEYAVAAEQERELPLTRQAYHSP